MLAWKLMIMENVAPALSDEPDAEPAGMADPHHVDDGVDSSFAEVPSSSTDLPTAARPPQTHPALTAENYIAWMIERCSRRRDATGDHDRRRLYEERVTILYGLRAASNSDVEGFRIGARRTLASMSDISEDESSPNFRSLSRPTNLSDAQLAYNFAENSAGLSTNVDMVASALGRGDAWPRCRWRFKPKFRRTHGNWIRSQTSISDQFTKRGVWSRSLGVAQLW